MKIIIELDTKEDLEDVGELLERIIEKIKPDLKEMLKELL